MSDYERELLQIIRNADDPGRAMEVAADIILRFVAGESIESIALIHGINLEAMV